MLFPLPRDVNHSWAYATSHLKKDRSAGLQRFDEPHSPSAVHGPHWMCRVAEARQALSTRWSFVRVAVFLRLQNHAICTKTFSHLSRRTNFFCFGSHIWRRMKHKYWVINDAHSETSPLSSPSTSDYQRRLTDHCRSQRSRDVGQKSLGGDPSDWLVDAQGVSLNQRLNSPPSISIWTWLSFFKSGCFSPSIVNNTNLSYTAH